MDTWGEVVRRVAGGSATAVDARPKMGALCIKPIVESLDDPENDTATVAEMLAAAQGGGRPSTGWFQRGRSAVSKSRHGAPLFNGKACCYEHIHGFEGRADLVLPFDTRCETCGASYRIRLAAIRR